MDLQSGYHGLNVEVTPVTLKPTHTPGQGTSSFISLIPSSKPTGWRLVSWT